jgi:tetratricopeptide (TPR) repeat protein/protocatechuate 3,4-dioxygenase beta subunit
MARESVKAEEIFHEAIEVSDAGKRSAYLDKACGNDSELRTEVEELLRAHEAAGGFLKEPLGGVDVTFDDSPLTEGPGTKIGRYKLLELIGEGGFGVVYMAEQREPIRRRVALKIIKLGMDTKQVIARFEAERQALAMMDHPNIAKVLDAGATETGRPYFVMELVKGIPVTEYCDKNNLNTRQRLEIFIDVCKAVQHAHQKGIIHRDLKPSNVMITLHDGVPVPKIIDFGIAKATGHGLTEKTLFTRYAHMVGTPEYMSPEQAEMSGLDVDTRSDIYSLGVLLYELLTGATPFDAQTLREAGYNEMQRIIREEEPDKPSTRLSSLGEALAGVAKHRHVEPAELRKIVRGDLDWVVMKTLEKNRTRRYETANELVRDIERHLGHEPVAAGPPSMVYRMKKFVRRNRTAVAVGLVVLASLVVGLALATTGFVQASRERDRALAAEAESVRQRDSAQTQHQRAEANFQKARDAVDRMLTQVAEELPRLPGMPERLDPPQVAQIKQALLEDALEYYEGFLEERSSDPLVRYETAHAYLRVGDITKLMRQYERSEETYIAAASLLKGLVAEFADEPDYHTDLARSYHGQAELLWEVGRLKEAEKAFREARAHYSKAIELNPSESGHWHWRGETYWKMKQWDKALADLSQAISLNPHESWHWGIRGGIYTDMERWDEAIVDFSKAIELEPNQGHYRLMRGVCYLELGEANKALEDYTKAIEVNPEDAHYWHMRATVYLKLGESNNAVADWTKAIELKPEDAHYWQMRGVSYLELGGPNKAIADFSKAIELEPNQDHYWHMRGVSYLELGELNKASADYSKAIELKPNHDHYWHMRGVSYLRLNQPAKAVADYTKAIDLNPENDHYRQQRIRAYMQLGQLDEATADLSKAIELASTDAADPESRRRLPKMYRRLGDMLEKMGRSQEAEEAYQKAEEIEDRKQMTEDRGQALREMRQAEAPEQSEFAAMEKRLQAMKKAGTSARVMVYPARVGGDHTDQSSATHLAELLNEAGLCRATVAKTGPVLKGEGWPAEDEVLWLFARAARNYVRQHPADTDYVLFADYWDSPRTKSTWAIHFVVCDRAGDWVIVDLQNNHHEDFQRINPKTLADGDRLMLERLKTYLMAQESTDDATRPASDAEALLQQEGPGMLVFVQTEETEEVITDASLQVIMNPDETMACERINLKTNELGFCRVEFGEGIPEQLTLRVTKPGFKPMGVLWNKDTSIPDEYTFRLEKGTIIGGRVINEQGEPVAGAFIDLWTPWLEFDHPNEARTAIRDTVKTDANGKWSADIVPADLVKEKVLVKLHHPDYFYQQSNSALRRLATIPALRSQNAQFILRRGFAVYGSVVDADGKPVEGAWVKLGEGLSEDPKIQTDGSGRFRFDGQHLGQTWITVEADAYAPDIRKVDLNASTGAIEFVLEPGNRIFGRVIDVNNRPVECACVYLAEWRWPHKLDWKTETDNQGRFEWDNAPHDEVEIQIHKDGYMRVQKSLVASDKEHEIVLYRLLRLKGEVVDNDTSEPVDEFDLTMRTIRKHGQPTRPGYNTRKHVQHTGGWFDITFDFYFWPEYEIEVKADGYEPSTSRRFTPDEGTVVLQIRMVRAARENIPQGTVYLPHGNVASGAEVYVTTRGLGLFRLEDGRRVIQGQAERVQTDSAGRFEAPVQPERFDLMAIHDTGYAEVSQEQLAESSEIHLESWGRVEGVVRTSSGPAVYERIRLTPQPRRWIQDQQRFEFTYTTATNEQGRFVVDRVIGGRMMIRRVTLNKDGLSYTDGANRLIEVVPGEATSVELVAGRPVIGRLSIPDEITRFEGWEGVYGSIDDLRFEVEVPVVLPEEYGTMTPEQRDKWHNGLFPYSEQDRMWQTQQSILDRTFYMTTDGSFHIYDVQPGSHSLIVNILATEKDPEGINVKYTPIGHVRHTFTMPEINPGQDKEPLDLGVIVIEPKKKMENAD